jgi:hypothetical protein
MHLHNTKKIRKKFHWTLARPHYVIKVINVIRTLPNDERLAGSESHASTSTNLLLRSASLTTGEGVDSVAEFFEKPLESPLMLDTLGEEGLLS